MYIYMYIQTGCARQGTAGTALRRDCSRAHTHTRTHTHHTHTHTHTHTHHTHTHTHTHTHAIHTCTHTHTHTHTDLLRKAQQAQRCVATAEELEVYACA